MTSARAPSQRPVRRGPEFWLVAGFVALALLTIACAARSPERRVEALRFSQLVDSGDFPRRASLRLVIEGLDADAVGESERARAAYERALQVDPTNPYAYLALGRHWIEAGRPERGLAFVDQAEVLLESTSLGVRVHLIGLRGRAAELAELAELEGTSEAAEDLLQRASDLAPEIWGDGILTAEELR